MDQARPRKIHPEYTSNMFFNDGVDQRVFMDRRDAKITHTESFTLVEVLKLQP